MSLKIYKLEITKEEYLKLKERLFELNPNIKLELVSCDDNLEKLGFTNSAPCKVDLHINEEEHKRLMDELMSIEEDACVFNDKENRDKFERYGWIWDVLFNL